MRFCIVLSALCILVSFATGQVDTAWMRLYDGPDNLRDMARALALDDSGNVYVTGLSYVTGVRTRIATLKYSGDGVLRWAALYDRQASFTTGGARVAVGPAGAIYVAGTTTGAGTQSDITTVKYTPGGDTVWARFLDGAAHSVDVAVGLGLDAAGNVYVTGGVVDAVTSSDFAVVKYDAAGNEQWVGYFRGGTGADVPVAAATDSAGNVHVVGTSEGPDTTSRIATVKFSPAGDTLWARFYQDASRSIEAPSSIVVDRAGNVFAAGSDIDATTNYDFVVIKYSPDGLEQWVRRYDEAAGMDLASPVAVDGAGAVYVAGQCEDSTGTAVCTVVKYDADGNLRWVRRYRSGDFTGARAVALDGRANVYVGGFCQLTDTTEMPLLVKYDSAGNEQWAVQHAPIPTGVGEVNKLAIGESASVYGAGWYGASGMSTDFLTAKYNQASGIEEREKSEVRRVKDGATVVRGVLHLPVSPFTIHTSLFDMTGRAVMSLRPGPNDVSRLATGVYFVRGEGRAAGAEDQTLKIVVQK